MYVPDSYWTSVLFATLSTYFSLVSSFCALGQMFAADFFQIPPRDGHPCLSGYTIPTIRARWGLAPVRQCSCRAYKKARGTRVYSAGHFMCAEVYCNLMSVMTCAPTAWFRASTSWSRRMCSSVRSTGEVRLTCRHWLRIYIWRVHRAAAGPATSVQACIRRYSLSGLSRPL